VEVAAEVLAERRVAVQPRGRLVTIKPE